MANPNRPGNLANATTSGAFCKKCAKSRSNALSAATRLNTVLDATKVGLENGNGGVAESLRPSSSSEGDNSSTTRLRSADANERIVTYCATLVEIALIISLFERSTV